MDSTERMRMCPYCEGTVPLDSPTCRFCGSSFDSPQESLKGAFREEAQTPHYTPPYNPGQESYQESVFYPENEEVVSSHEEENEEERGHLSALALLSCGGMLMTLSFLLYFFSEHGRVVLEWEKQILEPLRPFRATYDLLRL